MNLALQNEQLKEYLLKTNTGLFGLHPYLIGNNQDSQYIQPEKCEPTSTVNLENLAALVYKKLMLKKVAEDSKVSICSRKPQSLSECQADVSFASSKQENDKFLVDLILEQSTNENNKQHGKEKKPSSTPLDSKYFVSTQSQELEDTKLIEELFFI